MIGEKIEYLSAGKKKYIKYTMVNAIKMIISGKFDVNIEEKDSMGNYDRLVIEDICFDKGDTFQVDIEDITYNLKLLVISKNKNNYEFLLEDRNKSSIFVVPSLGYTQEYFGYDVLFVNSFLGRKELNEDLDEVYLVYRSAKVNSYVELDNRLRKHPAYIDSYDFGNTDVLLRFKIPAKYIPDVKRFVEGKYSMFSSDLRFKIFSFFKESHKLVENLKLIFTKDKKFVKKKYPEFDEETLDYIDEVFAKVNIEEEIIDV
jgi:hypothetical protein